MSRLPDIQEAFQRFLLSGDAEIGTHVVGTARVPVETRLGIYGGAYRARLVEALESSFPVLAELLGESDFYRLGEKYTYAYDSTVFSIRYYGDQMAAFLAADTEYAKAPVLAELARWEWAMADVFDAADAAPVDADTIAQIAPEDWAGLHFDWSPAVRVLELEWNVPEIWKAVTEGSAGADTIPDPRLEPVSWLIWRHDLQIFFRELSREEATAIAASRAGQTFGELCVALCEHLAETEAAGQAAGFLRGWVDEGLISSVG